MKYRGVVIISFLSLSVLQGCSAVLFSQQSSSSQSVPPSSNPTPTPLGLIARPDTFSDRPGITLTLPFSWVEYNDTIPDPADTTVSIASNCQTQGQVTIVGNNFVFTPNNSSSPNAPTSFVYQLSDPTYGTSQGQVTINPLNPFPNGLYASTATQLYQVGIDPTTLDVSILLDQTFAYNTATLLVSDLAMDSQNYLYASDGNSIYVVDTTGRLTPVVSILNLVGEPDVQGIEFLPDGRLLILGSNGLYVYNFSSLPVLIANTDVYQGGDLTVINNNVYWSTTAYGSPLYSVPVASIANPPVTVTPIDVGSINVPAGAMVEGLLPLKMNGNLIGFDSCGDTFQINSGNASVSNIQTFLNNDCFGGWTGATHSVIY